MTRRQSLRHSEEAWILRTGLPILMIDRLHTSSALDAPSTRDSTRLIRKSRQLSGIRCKLCCPNILDRPFIFLAIVWVEHWLRLEPWISKLYSDVSTSFIRTGSPDWETMPLQTMLILRSNVSVSSTMQTS